MTISRTRMPNYVKTYFKWSFIADYLVQQYMKRNVLKMKA